MPRITQLIDVVVDGSSPVMLVRELSQIASEISLSSMDRLELVYRLQALVWQSSDDRFLDTLGLFWMSGDHFPSCYRAGTIGVT